MIGRIQDAIKGEWAWQQQSINQGKLLKIYLEKKKKTGYYTENDEKNEPGKGKGPVKEPC